MRLRTPFSLFLFFSLSFLGCKKWDDHIAPDSLNLTQNLWQVLSANASLSTFAGYARQSGVDSLLQSSKTFTVWAPTNDALKTLDPAIVADAAKLKSFVLNHIANGSYFTRDVQTAARVPVLNGKYQNITALQFDEAILLSKDNVAANGVVHTLDRSIAVLPSLWDFVNTANTPYAQNAYIAGLNFNDFDSTTAIVDSISAGTGTPVYRPGTGIVVRNKFNTRVYDLKNEAKQYTYFVIANGGFALESDSLKKYYATASATVTDSLAKWNVVKDLTIEGLYQPTAIFGLQSKFGVPLPVVASDIVEIKKFSNGLVYVLNKLDVPTAAKFPTLVVQGENPTGFSVVKTANTNYRIRVNPATGQQFIDLLVSGHGVTGYYSFYSLSEVPSIKYKVYALGVNDFQTTTFSQSIVGKYKIATNTYTTLATLPHAVPYAFMSNGAYNLAAYAEVYVGDVTMTSFGTLEIQLTSSGTNPILLDYLRLVPQP